MKYKAALLTSAMLAGATWLLSARGGQTGRALPAVLRQSAPLAAPALSRQVPAPVVPAAVPVPPAPEAPGAVSAPGSPIVVSTEPTAGG